MNKLLTATMIALLTISASAQTTDRLSASSVLHYNQKGVETDKDLIEIFRYEAQTGHCQNAYRPTLRPDL